MKVAGFDLATSSGVALIDYARPEEEWSVFAIQAEGDNAEAKAADFARALHAEIGADLPDFAAIEMPQRNVQRFEKKRNDMAGPTAEMTINPNALVLSAIAGAAVTVLELLGIGWGLIAPATWRANYFGKGVKPADGNWKALAVERARLQRVFLPDTAKARHDAAEALGIGLSWSKCTFIDSRHQAAFMALRQLPLAAPVPADLTRKRAA